MFLLIACHEAEVLYYFYYYCIIYLLIYFVKIFHSSHGPVRVKWHWFRLKFILLGVKTWDRQTDDSWFFAMWHLVKHHWGWWRVAAVWCAALDTCSTAASMLSEWREHLDGGRYEKNTTSKTFSSSGQMWSSSVVCRPEKTGRCWSLQCFVDFQQFCSDNLDGSALTSNLPSGVCNLAPRTADTWMMAHRDAANWECYPGAAFEHCRARGVVTTNRQAVGR